MTNWITLTVEKVADYQVGGKLAAVRTKALASGQGDPLPKAIADVVRDVRVAIGSHPRHRLSATADAIPPELELHTLALVIEAAGRRLPGILTEDDRKAADVARARMRMVSHGEIGVTEPTDPIAGSVTQAGPSATLLHATMLQTSRDKLAGL